MTEDVAPEPAGHLTDDDPTRRAPGVAGSDAFADSPVVLVGPGVEPMVDSFDEDEGWPAADAHGSPGEPMDPLPEVRAESGSAEEPPAHGPLDAAGAADDGAATASGEVDTSRREPTEDGGPSEALGAAAAATEAVDSAPAQPSVEEPGPAESQADDAPQAQPVVEKPVLAEAPAVDADGPLEEESPLDDLTWDAIAVALATEPPIPPGPEPTVAGTAPHAWPGADPDAAPLAPTEAGWPAPEEWPDVAWAPDPEVDDDESSGVATAPPDDAPPEQALPDQAMASESMADQAVADEVADFWDPPPLPPIADADADSDTGGDRDESDAEPLPGPLVPAPWLATDDLVGVEGLAADWMRADADRSGGSWQVDEWGDDDRPPRRWHRIVAPLTGRWSTMRRGERVNVVLYALTGVSILAMALELLAGPDSPPTDVSTSPAPAASTPTTARPATTVTFTIPQAPPPPAPGPETAGGPATPVRVTPTAPAVTAAPTPAPPAPEPEPEPEPEPPVVTAPPQTTPTTRPTPTTNPGFPEPTLPVLPTFPGPPVEP